MTVSFFHKSLKRISDHISEFKLRRKRWGGGCSLYVYGLKNDVRSRSHRKKTEIIDIGNDGLYRWVMYGNYYDTLKIEKGSDSRLIIIGIDEV